MPEELQRAWQAARGKGLEVEVADQNRVPVALGQIVDWNQPRFALDPAGSEGLWQPATSLNRYGLGIWFLEPYDPQRIPVLLVHGLGGTAGDWKEFSAKLDTKRFQVWLYAYPSGLRIGESADVARAVSFFADPANSYVTGQVLYVCGGTSVGALTL